METSTETLAVINKQTTTQSALELYKQHAPKYLRQRLHHKIFEGEKVNAESTQVYASVLFADISGFTQLSSRLSAEELQSHINEYFTKLLGIVEENVGDVVKFCGDAVLIMWAVPLTASDEIKAAAVLMSSLCALQMLEECGEYRRVRHSVPVQSPGSPTRTRLSVSRALSPAIPSPGSAPSHDSPLKSPSYSPQRASLTGALSPGLDVVELSLHCGISCGTVHCMMLGDAQRLEFILSGEVISQMGAAEACAKAGEVCLHPAAYEKVCDKLRGEAVYPPSSVPKPPCLAENSTIPAQPMDDPSFPHGSSFGDEDNVVRGFEDETEPGLREETPFTPRKAACTGQLDPSLIVSASDQVPGDPASMCEEDRKLSFVISDLVLSPPHSVICDSPTSARTAALGHNFPTFESAPEPKDPPSGPEPTTPISFLLTGRLSESLELSLKCRSRSSVRCTSTAYATGLAATSNSSVSLLGRSDRERTGSVVSFGAASDRVSSAGLFVSTKWSPGESPLPRSVSQDVAAVAAEAVAQRQYALHELGIFPSSESAAELKPSAKNTLSVSTVQYLASLAREITGISSKPRLVRSKTRISAADVLPQANFSHKNGEAPTRATVRFDRCENCEDNGRIADEKGHFLGGVSGRNVSFRRQSLFGLFRSAKIRSETTDPAAGELKNDGEEEKRCFCTPEKEKSVFSAGARAEMSAKDSPSAVQGAGVSSRLSIPLSSSSRHGAQLSRKLQRQVTRKVSMLYANTRSSLGMFLPLSGSVLMQNTASGYFSSTSAAAANDLEHDYFRVVSSIDAAGVSQSPQNVHFSTGVSENNPNWDGFGPPPVSSSSGEENERVPLFGCPSSASGEDLPSSLLSSQPHKVRKMPVARLKRKLKIASDVNIRAVRAYQDELSSSSDVVSAKEEAMRSNKFISGSNRERNGVFQARNATNGQISCLNDAQAARLERELARFAHETAARAIDSNTVSFLSEMRDVAVVFMQILDLQHDFAAGLHLKPQRVLCVILKLLRQFGGSLRQFVVDDKGCVAIGCFGLSGSSSENNCLQAVEFAVTARTLLHTLGCRTASGITLGRVYCGLVGARGRCEYAVMGASVNLAARLMAACALTLARPLPLSHSAPAHGYSSSVLASETSSSSAPRGVFVDAAVHSLAYHQFQFEEHAHIAAKGYSEPVPVFVAMRKRATIRLIPTRIESETRCEGGRRREELFCDSDRLISRQGPNLTLSGKVKSTKPVSNSPTSPLLFSPELPMLERDGVVREILDLLVSDGWVHCTGRSTVRTFSGGSQKSRDSALSGVQTRPKAVLERCLLIEGPSGVGRSSLLRQVLHQLTTVSPETPRLPDSEIGVAPCRFKIAAVVCDPANQYIPYHLVRSLLCEAIGIEGAQRISEELAVTPGRAYSAENTEIAEICLRTTSTSSSTANKSTQTSEALLHTWCEQHVPAGLSLGAAFALCHPGLHLFEVLLFHNQHTPSGEKNFSAAEENPRHASNVAELCETPLVCFLPLLNDIFGTNIRFMGPEMVDIMPFEVILEGFLSPALRELLVDVLLQMLLMCVLGHQSLLMDGTHRECVSAGRDALAPHSEVVSSVLAVDDLQHADSESLNLICKVLSKAASLDTSQRARSGCFIATYCDVSTDLSAIITSATLTGVSAASLSVTRPLRQSIALHTETCASVEDLFCSTNVHQEAPSYHKLMKIIRKHSKVIAVPRLSKQVVRALMCRTLGPEMWAWVLNNASLVLGTATHSAKIKRTSPLPPALRSTNVSPTDDRRAAALALLLSSRQSSGSLFPSSSHAAHNTYTTNNSCTTDSVSVQSTSVRPRRGGSFHVPTTASAAPDRACFTSDGAAGIAMTEASAASVGGQVRQHLTRRPRGQTEESKIVSLVYALSQNGLPRGVIEICGSLRHAIDTNAFNGLHSLPVVVKRNKLLLEVLDHLSGVEVVALKAAAVIGERFDSATLVAVLMGMGMLQCTQESVLDSVLSRLVSVGLVRCAGASDECGVMCKGQGDIHSTLSAAHTEHTVVYEFVESTTQLAIYNLMMETQRAVAHGAIGAYLEALYDCTHNDNSTYSAKSTYDTYNTGSTHSTYSTQRTCTTRSSANMNHAHHYTPTQLLHITHHYRHSDNITKKVEYLLYCAQHYTSVHYYTSAIAVYNELITLALGMCIDDVVSVCRENEISAVAVLQMLTIPQTPVAGEGWSSVSRTDRLAHSSTAGGGAAGVVGSGASTVDAAALRQQLFFNQVAVLDVGMLRQRKSGWSSGGTGGRWWRWLGGASKISGNTDIRVVGSPSSHTRHPTTTATATRVKPKPSSSYLVSSLAQDTAHALHHQHCAQQLAHLSLSELLVQRRVLLRALAAHSGDTNTKNGSGADTSTAAVNNAYTPLAAPPVLALRAEVAACGVGMVRVAKWVSYLAELHNRCEEEEDGVEYAALALHLIDLSTVPTTTRNTNSTTTGKATRHSAVANTTGASKSVLNGIYGKMTTKDNVNGNSSDKSTNSTNSTNSSDSVNTSSVPDASADSRHSNGSVNSSDAVRRTCVEDVLNQSYTCKPPIAQSVPASGVCCGWWSSRAAHAKVAIAPLPRVPPLILPVIPDIPVIHIASAVNNVLQPHYPLLPHTRYHKRSSTSNNTLHALLHPTHTTSTSAHVYNCALAVTKSCLDAEDVSGVIVLLESLFNANNAIYTTASSRAVRDSTALLLSQAFTAVGDSYTAALLVPQGLVYTDSTVNSVAGPSY